MSFCNFSKVYISLEDYPKTSMELLVYKFSDYEHTAGRKLYRALCKHLKTYYENRDEICIFVANYNIYDCELDGIIPCFEDDG